MTALDWNDCDGDVELVDTKLAAKRLLIKFLESEQAKTQTSSGVSLVEDAVVVLGDELLAWARSEYSPRE